MAHVEKKYNYAVIATDVAIFTVHEGKSQVLLIKMKKKPYADSWALPGGLVAPRESLREAALRHLQNKTGVKQTYLEQLYTFGDVDRDPFGRVVSVAYMALIPNRGVHLKTTKEYGEVRWFPVKHLPSLAYDHVEVIHYALERLKAKLAYSNAVYSLLPLEFTLSDLQAVYESILSKRLDKRNFRKKILALGIIRDVRKKKVGIPNRPATLYAFIKRSPMAVEIL